MCLVSVCIPTFNRKKYLLEALNSVIAQSYCDYEIVVVDDGSTDGTREMIEAINKPIRYYYQMNSGLATARNKLIELARGKYISFLDSDDLLAPKALKRLVQAANGREDICVYGDYIRINQNGEKLPTKPKIRPSGMILDALFGEILVDSCGNLFPKKVLVDTGGFDEKLRNTPDYIKYLQLAKSYEFIGINMPTFFRRRHGNNMSQAKCEAVLEEFNLLQDFYFNQGGELLISRKIAMRRLGKEAYRVAKLAKMEKLDQEFANIYFRKALKYHPNAKVIFWYIISQFSGESKKK